MKVFVIAGIILVGLMDCYYSVKGGDNTVAKFMKKMTKKQKLFFYTILIGGVALFYLSEILYFLN